MGIKRVTIECADQVFCVRDSGVEVWRCMVGGGWAAYRRASAPAT